MRIRRGIALVATLALMMFIGILVVGGVASSMLAQRASRLSQTDALLTAAADFAINTVLADPSGYGLDSLPYGAQRVFTISNSAGNGISTRLTVTRLTGGVLWLVAEGSVGGVDAGHRRFNVVARFPSIGALPPAGIVARGNVDVGAGVSFSLDSASDPDCRTVSSADFIVAPGSIATIAGNARAAVSAQAQDSSTFFLTSWQLTTLQGGTGVVRVRGDTTIAGGSHAGVLIVDGNLTIVGPYSVIGLLIVRGRVTAHAGGFSLTGGMMVFGAGSAPSGGINIDGAIVRYSPCAMRRALWIALPARPTSQRSWAELF